MAIALTTALPAEAAADAHCTAACDYSSTSTYYTTTHISGSIYDKEVDQMRWHGTNKAGCQTDRWRRDAGYIKSYYGGSQLYFVSASSYSTNCSSWVTKSVWPNESSTDDLSIRYYFYHKNDSVPDFSFVSCAWIRYQNSGLSRYYTGCGS